MIGIWKSNTSGVFHLKPPDRDLQEVSAELLVWTGIRDIFRNGVVLFLVSLSVSEGFWCILSVVYSLETPRGPCAHIWTLQWCPNRIPDFGNKKAFWPPPFWRSLSGGFKSICQKLVPVSGKMWNIDQEISLFCLTRLWCDPCTSGWFYLFN